MKTLTLLLCLLCASCFSQSRRILTAQAPVVEATSWTPTTPTNTLIEWIKADAMVMADGAQVQKWTNSAGFDLNTKSVGYTWPTNKTNIKNGKNVIRFNGSSDNIGSPINNTAFSNAQPFTICMVFNYTGSTAADCAIMDCAYPGDKRCLVRTNPGASKWRLYTGTGYQDTWVLDNNWHAVILEVNGASTRWAIDGGGFSTIAGSPGTHSMVGVNLGSTYSGDSLFAAVDWAEWILVNGTINATDAAGFFSYANTRWTVY